MGESVNCEESRLYNYVNNETREDRQRRDFCAISKKSRRNETENGGFSRHRSPVTSVLVSIIDRFDRISKGTIDITSPTRRSTIRDKRESGERSLRKLKSLLDSTGDRF